MPRLNLTGVRQPYPAIADDFTQFLSGLYDQYQAGDPSLPTPEQQIAPLDPMQLSAISDLGAFGTTGTGAGLEAATAGAVGAPLDMGAVGSYMDVFGTPGGGLDMGEVAGYADNPYLDSVIDASLRDPYRQFTEQTLPGISSAESLLGGGGARTDIARGIAERGFLDRASDVAAGLRGSAYGKGLDTALATRGQDITHGLGAGRSALDAALGTRGQDIRYADLAADIGLGNIGAGLSGGNILQNQEQMLRDARLMNFVEERDAPWRLADRYAALTASPANVFGEQYGDPTATFLESLGAGLSGSFIGGIGNWLGTQLGEEGGWLDSIGGFIGDIFRRDE